jgi:tRNA (adenine22-N1)-methyltransferase
MVKSKRLKTLASLTKGFDVVLDIGTDHGLVLKEAIDLKYIQKGIASDVRELPLNKAKQNLKGYPVTYYLSDGFLSIEESYDAVLIAGMGAYLMSDILKNAPQGDITYILQANDKIDALRQSLQQQGFKIIEEHIVYETHDYIILVVKRGEMDLTEVDILLGPVLRHKKEARKHYDKQIKKIESFINQVDAQRKKTLLKQIEIYRNN